MKTWNTPEVKELKLSGTELHGTDQRHIDGFVYDAERDTNWASYSGGNVDKDAQGADVVIHPTP